MTYDTILIGCGSIGRFYSGWMHYTQALDHIDQSNSLVC